MDANTKTENAKLMETNGFNFSKQEKTDNQKLLDQVSQYQRRCNARIQLDKDGRQETYCILKEGHKGEHLDEILRPNVSRCDSKKSGLQCGLPVGHFGKHQNGARGTWQ